MLKKGVNKVEVRCMGLLKNLRLHVLPIFIIVVAVEPIDPTRLRTEPQRSYSPSKTRRFSHAPLSTAAYFYAG